MTTAAIDKPTTSASETSDSPKDTDLASVFYGTEPEPASDSPKETATPTTEPDNGSSTTPEKASADPADSAKPGDSPKGEEKKEEKKPDDGGHRAAAARLGNEVKELKTQVEAMAEENRILKEKADGTYQKPKDPTPEQIRAKAEFDGRESASRSVAFEKYGKDVVRARVYGVDENGKLLGEPSEYEVLVKGKPWLQERVMRSQQPAMEAMRVLEQEAFIATYGDDPTQWATKIEAELRPKIMDELKKQTKTQPTGKDVPTVTEGRGSGGPERERSMADVFYGPEKKG